MSILYFLFQWLKQIKEEKKAKVRSEVRRSPRTKDVKVFYKESSSSDDTKKKATIKAEAKTVAGRKFPSPDAQRVRRSTTLNFKRHSHRFLPLVLGLSFDLLNFIDAGLHLLGSEEAYPLAGMG